ncbi:hypothetical protein GIY23_08330 [Allosaccharopolyspora coralli]|uniref:Asp23/Gls24 family envelope stress response protein n=1 Tax=Allosaccharopolyspora coralli TaxID=2665642 RepID=A0A5Q3QD97_9PSEU|nr:hypothetical protein [Allosaccharopolyspora coralli]QGK69529.1 hypothetical protein GIY23_08330 [Allosaccharopolyspora coralli]
MSGSGIGVDRTLPCGRTESMLLAHLDGQGPRELAEHVRDCPYCSRRLESMQRSWQPVRAAARTPVELPTGLVERAMETVRGMRSVDGHQPASLPQEGGTVTVSSRATLTLARQAGGDAAASRSGVHLRRCHGGPDGMRIELAVRYSLPAHEVADSVRVEVEGEMRRALGPLAPPVDVAVVDVTPPPG